MPDTLPVVVSEVREPPFESAIFNVNWSSVAARPLGRFFTTSSVGGVEQDERSVLVPREAVTVLFKFHVVGSYLSNVVLLPTYT